MTYDSREFDKMFNMILLLSKKRGQPKKALLEMVQLGMSFIGQINDISLKLRLIEVLKEVCDKKIFLEVCCFSLFFYDFIKIFRLNMPDAVYCW